MRSCCYPATSSFCMSMLQEMSDMMTAQRALQSAAQVLKLYDGVLTKATTELGRL